MFRPNSNGFSVIFETFLNHSRKHRKITVEHKVLSKHCQEQSPTESPVEALPNKKLHRTCSVVVK